MSRLGYASPGRPRAAPATGAQGVVVGLAVVLMAGAGAIVYARQGAAEVAYRLIVEGTILLAWLAAAAGLGAWPTRWLLTGQRRSASLTVVTSAGVGLGVMSVLTLLLGLAGLLSTAIAVALLVVGVALGTACLLRSRKDTPPEPDQIDDGRWRWLWLAVVPALSMALVAAYVTPGMLWKPEEPHGYDVVEYHFQVPREWFDAGRIAPLEHNVFSYFPFAVEMHYLLAFHLRGGAWEGMYLAQLMHLAMVALSVVAVSGFAKELARRRSIATIASVAGATVPWLALLAPIGFNEGGLLLYGTLAIGFVALALTPSPGTPGEGRGEGSRERRKQGGGTVKADTPGLQSQISDLKSEISDSKSQISNLEAPSPHPSPLPAYRERGPILRLFALAGLCAGFACGVKLTAVPLLLLAVPAVAFLLLVRRSPRVGFAAAAVFVIVGLIAFSPWLIRNLAWTGNPVFPEGRAFFGDGPFTDVQADRWQKAHAARPDQQAITARLSALMSQVVLNWQFGWILLPLGVAALVINWRSPVSRLLGGLLLIQTIFWLALTHLQGRFFVLAIPIAVLAIAATDWTFARQQVARWVPAVLAAVVVLAGLWSALQVHRRLAFKLYEDQGTGIDVALGQTDINWVMGEAIDGFPIDDPAARLVLVGDAQGFWYPLTAERLSYRTVFDLETSTNPSLLQAFDPKGWRRGDNTWLLITPTELDRFEKTYQPLPKIPDAWRQSPRWQAGLPFLVPPAQVQQWSVEP